MGKDRAFTTVRRYRLSGSTTRRLTTSRSPERAKAQILLHARHQYLEGDACKSWHRAPNGGTGLADRTHSSDPHLWLPYVTLKYIQGTGDHGILNEVRAIP